MGNGNYCINAKECILEGSENSQNIINLENLFSSISNNKISTYYINNQKIKFPSYANYTIIKATRKNCKANPQNSKSTLNETEKRFSRFIFLI